MFPTILYKLCSVATPKQYRPLHLENYVRIVAFAPDLRKVPFHGVIEFLRYSSTIEFLLHEERPMCHAGCGAGKR